MSKLRKAYERNNGGSGGLVCPFCGGRDFEVYRTEKSAITKSAAPDSARVAIERCERWRRSRIDE